MAKEEFSNPQSGPSARNTWALEQNSSPRPSAQLPPQLVTQQNLAISDWLTVFEFVDLHPLMTQKEVVEHFKAKKEAPLHFTESMLSHNLKQRAEMEKDASSQPHNMMDVEENRDAEPMPQTRRRKAMQLAKTIEEFVLADPPDDPDLALGLLRSLRKYRGHFCREECLSRSQGILPLDSEENIGQTSQSGKGESR